MSRDSEFQNLGLEFRWLLFMVALHSCINNSNNIRYPYQYVDHGLFRGLPCYFTFPSFSIFDAAMFLCFNLDVVVGFYCPFFF